MRALFLHNARAKLSLHAGAFGQSGPLQCELGFDGDEVPASVVPITQRDDSQLVLFEDLR